MIIPKPDFHNVNTHTKFGKLKYPRVMQKCCQLALRIMCQNYNGNY